MKILKIFGIVVGLHLAGFLMFFAIPGCRSTSKPPVGEPAATPMGSPIVPAPAPIVTSFDPVAPVVGVRASPTRPDSPSATVLVPPAMALTPPAAVATSYTVKSGDTLSVIGKKHGLKASEIAAANKIAVDAVLRPGQKLTIPTAAARPTPTGRMPADAPADTNDYTVKSGDTLKTIAQRNRTTADSIKALNNLRTDTVQAGQKLKLPVPAPSAAALAPAASGGTKHIVKSGETLSDIAHKYGVKLGDIATINGITSPNNLHIGQELKIPSKTAAAPASPVVPAETSPIRPVSPPPPAATAPSNFNFTLPSGMPPAPQPAATPVSPSPAPAPTNGPIIKIEGDGAPRIP